MKKERMIKAFNIAGTDITEYRIVYRKDDEYAAKELSSFIYEACGVRLPMYTDKCGSSREIRVGRIAETEKVKEAVEKLGDDGYAIIYDETSLHITGKTKSGVLYGVYTFIEDKLGFRFLSSKFTAHNGTDTVEISGDLNETYTPPLINRDTYWYDSFELKFAARRKLNGTGGRADSPYISSMLYAGGFVHTLPHLAGTSTAPDAQPCLTDEKIYEKVIGNVRKLLRENPKAKIISVSQNDSYPEGRGCQCENCRKLDEAEGTPMGSLLTFVNRVADDIKDEFPGVYVDTLAYRYTRKAPKHLKPRDNVIIRLCSIECCFAHPLTGDCAANKEFAADIKAWSKISKNLFIWDYTTDFLYYVNPFPNLKVLQKNVRFFIDHNVIGMFEQGNGQSYSAEFGELRAYLISKLLWDPYMSEKEYYAHMDEFLRLYYGPGWKHIREYIDKTSEKAKEKHLGIYDRADKVFNAINDEGQIDPEFAEEMKRLWDSALEVSDGVYRTHVECSAQQIESALLCLRHGMRESTDGAKKLYLTLKKHNITYFREGVPMPETEEGCRVLID